MSKKYNLIHFQQKKFRKLNKLFLNGQKREHSQHTL